MTKMDHPTSPSPLIGRPRDSAEYPKLQKMNLSWKTNHSKSQTAQPSNPRSIPVRTRGTLTAEVMKVVNLNDSLATPVLELLDLYFCLWQCYVVKSAEKIRLEEEQRQLQASNDLLASDSDILLQLCNEQASVLWERKRAVQALCNGVVSALEASDLQVYSVDELEP
ncbi:unnamed protein product [Penicillium nalgiovense]|nr:unnamed protein product [Penicillium nalgiovense]